MPPVSLWISALFVLTVVGVCAGLSAAIGRVRGGRAAALTALVLGGWLALTGGVAAAGWLRADSLPPGPVRLLLPATVAVVALAASPLGGQLARLPLAVLIGGQVFRVPVEVVLAALAAEGAIPERMSWSGENFDVMTGLSAPVVVLLAAAGWLPRWARIGWNLAGLGLLANIVTIAVMSMPGPLQVFTDGPPNLLPLSAPWIWLPTVLVMTALLGHLLALRAEVGQR